MGDETFFESLQWYFEDHGYDDLSEIEDRLVTSCAINDMSWRTPYPDDDEPYYVVSDLDPYGPGHGTWEETLPTVRRHFESRVSAILGPWHDLPDPALGTAVLTDLNTAMGTLNAGEIEGLGGLQGPEAIGQQITDLENKIHNFSGDTITVFRNQVLGQLNRVADNQALLTSFLGKCIAGEVTLWTNTRSQVRDLAMAALFAASDAGKDDSQDGASTGQQLAVVGAILVGAAVFGPGAVALTVTGTAATVAGTLWEEEEAPAKYSDPYHLAGTRPDDVLDNLQSRLDTIKESVREEESLLDGRLARALKLTGNHRHVYDLKPARAIWSKTNADLLEENHPNKSGAKESFVVPTILHKAATDEMQKIANAFGTASKLIDVKAFTNSFQRPEGLGLSIVDLGSTYEFVAGNVQFAMKSTEGDVDSCADHLRIAANIHDKNDAQVGAELEKHRKKVEKNEYVVDG